MNNITDYILINQLNKTNREIYKNTRGITKLNEIKGFTGISSAISDIKISKIETEARGTIQGSKNIQDGITLIQVADNSLNKMSELGKKLKELSINYNNDTLSDIDRNNLEVEANEYLKEYLDIAKNTSFNKHKLFEKDEYTIQTGAYQNEKFTIKLNIKDKLNRLTGYFDALSNTNDIVVDDDIDYSKLKYIKNLKDNQINYEGWVDENGLAQLYGNIYNQPNQVKLYEGFIKNGKKEGDGILFNEKAELIYKGSFKNDKFNGYGEKFSENGKLEYRGYFLNGKKEGYGISFNEQGQVLQEGVWKDGKFISNAKSNISHNFASELSFNFEKYKSKNIIEKDSNSDNIFNSSYINETQNSNNHFSIKDILNEGFIDDNIIEPVTTLKTSLSVQEDILSQRADLNTNKLNIYDNFVKIKSADEYSSLILNLQENIEQAQRLSSLYSSTLNNRRDILLDLLR